MAQAPTPARHGYIKAVRAALEEALKLNVYLCQQVENQDRPIIELGAPVTEIKPTVMIRYADFGPSERKEVSKAAPAWSIPTKLSDFAAAHISPATSNLFSAPTSTPKPSGAGTQSTLGKPSSASSSPREDAQRISSGGGASISRECCFIEPSTNSVRVSFRLQQSDALDEALLGLYMRFLMQRADELGVLRRIAVVGYDISFLVTTQHLREMGDVAIAEVIAGCIEASNQQVSELKLAVSARGRAVASELFKSLTF